MATGYDLQPAHRDSGAVRIRGRFDLAAFDRARGASILSKSGPWSKGDVYATHDVRVGDVVFQLKRGEAMGDEEGDDDDDDDAALPNHASVMSETRSVAVLSSWNYLGTDLPAADDWATLARRLNEAYVPVGVARTRYHPDPNQLSSNDDMVSVNVAGVVRLNIVGNAHPGDVLMTRVPHPDYMEQNDRTVHHLPPHAAKLQVVAMRRREVAAEIEDTLHTHIMRQPFRVSPRDEKTTRDDTAFTAVMHNTLLAFVAGVNVLLRTGLLRNVQLADDLNALLTDDFAPGAAAPDRLAALLYYALDPHAAVDDTPAAWTQWKRANTELLTGALQEMLMRTHTDSRTPANALYGWSDAAQKNVFASGDVNGLAMPVDSSPQGKLLADQMRGGGESAAAMATLLYAQAARVIGVNLTPLVKSADNPYHQAHAFLG